MHRYPEGDLDTNLTIVITNVGADFTRLGSFGDAEQFGGNVVAQMDRSYLNRSWNKPKSPVQVATALDTNLNMYTLWCFCVSDCVELPPGFKCRRSISSK